MNDVKSSTLLATFPPDQEEHAKRLRDILGFWAVNTHGRREDAARFVAEQVPAGYWQVSYVTDGPFRSSTDRDRGLEYQAFAAGAWHWVNR